MVIRRLKIKNFGKIRDKDMELSPGINVLYGENESGKLPHIHLSAPCFMAFADCGERLL